MRVEVIDNPATEYSTSKRTHIIIWDTMSEMVAAVCEKKPSYVALPTNKSFVGRKFNSWDEIAKACDSVWTEGIELVEAMLAEMANVKLPAPKNIRRRGTWSNDQGDDFDLDRYRSGQEFWRTTTRRRTGGPQIITLLVHTGGNAGTSPEALLWRGAACTVLADRLEAAGYRTEIMAYDYGERVFCSGDNECQAVWLKRSQDPLNLSTLINGVSGWFFRTIMFGGYSVCPGQTPTKTLGVERVLPDRIKPYLSHERAWVVQQISSKSSAIVAAQGFLSTLAEGEQVQTTGVATW